MSTPAISKTTQAFYLQAGLSFAIAVGAVVLGIVYLPVDPWMRAFLAIGSLFLVTSTFTLAKCVRDAQESSQLHALDPFQLQR
jgi:hypothetical protein